MLLGFNAKVVREFFLEQTIRNESLHEINNDNGIRAIHFDTSKSLRVKSTKLLHRSIYKYTWTSSDGEHAIKLTIF
jgi:hypothetical protein